MHKIMYIFNQHTHTHTRKLKTPKAIFKHNYKFFKNLNKSFFI